MPHCGKVMNLLGADIEKIISEYNNNFLLADKKLQKNFCYNPKTKKFEYKNSSIGYAFRGIDTLTFKFKSDWEKYTIHASKTLSHSDLRKTMLEMKALQKIQKDYNITVFFLLQTYRDLYPGCFKGKR